MASQGVVMLWSPFVGKAKVDFHAQTVDALDPDDLLQAQERVKMKISHLVEHVGKKPIPPGTKHLVMELLVSDEQGEDVDVGLTQSYWVIAMLTSICADSVCDHPPVIYPRDYDIVADT